MSSTLRDFTSGQHYDAVIIGAGPVGSLLASLLGSQRLRVLVLEKRPRPPEYSMAIGITPPSLRILQKLNLAESFISAGVPVRDCIIHGESGRLGGVSFRSIPGEHPFILSLPQATTVTLLHQRLAELSSVTLCHGVEVTDVSQDHDRATVAFHSGPMEDPQTISAPFVIACDGWRSRIRDQIGVRKKGGDYRCHFAMGDLPDSGAMRDEAHLFFKADGAVESFPLPGGRRRWIVQTEQRVEEPPQDLISSTVLKRTGITLRPSEPISQSSFTPQWFNCDTYHRKRIVLCGDAAHGMSPIGGQGMNTGFADAEFLAGIFETLLGNHESHGPLLAAYDQYRRHAAQSAIRRAEWGMWFGTWSGRFPSLLRDFIIRHLLCKGPIAPRMGPFYAMQTIPYNTLDRVPMAQINAFSALKHVS